MINNYTQYIKESSNHNYKVGDWLFLKKDFIENDMWKYIEETPCEIVKIDKTPSSLDCTVKYHENQRLEKYNKLHYYWLHTFNLQSPEKHISRIATKDEIDKYLAYIESKKYNL